MSSALCTAAVVSLATLFTACSQPAAEYPGPGDAPDRSAPGTTAQGPAEPSAYPPPTDDVIPAPAAFEDLDWHLVGSGDPAMPSVPPDSVAVTARFDSATRNVGGSAGCNSYSAPYDHAGPSMQIEEARATLMACDAPAMEVEAAYLAMLARITAWEVTADQPEAPTKSRQLTLKTGDGMVLVYRIAEESLQ
jgi:heat shock protein HslJ